MATHTERERLERMLLGQEQVLVEVHQILYDEQKQDDLLRALVLSSTQDRPAKLRGVDPQRVFHRDTIKDLCIRYRLRFLPGGLFKGTLPVQAVYALRRLERKAEGPLGSFMIMAPSQRFKLCDSEVDPLLFVPIGQDQYYLVHKWGTDLSIARRVMGWPFRSARHLAVAVFAMAVLIGLLVPTHLVTTDPTATFWGSHRLLVMVWSAMVCASFTVFGWFAFFGQFSAETWNSRYFN